MIHASVTQEYLLCALDQNGKIPSLNSIDITTCLVTSGILELLKSQTIMIDQKNGITAVKTLSDGDKHLKPLYETIGTKSRIRIEDIAVKYVFGSGKLLNEWMEVLCIFLAEHHYVTETMGGILHSSKRYVPNQVEVLKIIEKMRADFLEEGPLDDETVILGALLHKSRLIKNYYSKFESDQMKKRIQEVKNSEAGMIVKKMVDYIDIIIAVIASASGVGGI